MKFNLPKVFLVLIGIIIFLYIVMKATVSSFTYDESFTYLHYVHDSFMDIVSYKGWYTNNHLLNTLFMKYSELLFGSSEIALRLTNLLLLSVYMVYSYLLFRKTGQLLVVAVFILLCTNNSLIDLFGLARGYGLSCGFMLMSFYHFVQSFENQKTKNTILFHVGALLAVMSSFILLIFYVALLLIYIVVIYSDNKFISKKKYNFFRSNKIHAIPLLIIIIILYEPVRRVVMNNDLDFGGKNGFYEDTVSSLIYNSLHNIFVSPGVLLFLQIIFTGIVLLPLIIIIRRILRGDAVFFSNNRGLIIANFLIVFISIAIVLQHTLFGTDYPVARFSIFLFPLFIIHFGFFLFYLNNTYRIIVPSIALGLALISATSFGLKANLYSCSEWAFNMDTKDMILKLSKCQDKEGNGSTKIKLGISWLFDSTINFYRQTKELQWLLPVDRSGLKAGDDYYYIFKEELNKLNSADYEVIVEFERTNTVLLKNLKH